MKQRGKAARAGAWFMASLALLVAVSVAGADADAVDLPEAGDFAVHAVITPGPEGGHVDFTGGWEDEIDFGVAVNSDGAVSVNGIVIGNTDPNSALAIRVDCTDGTASVTVFDADTGSFVCSMSGVILTGDPVRAGASGASVHSLVVH